MPRTPLSLRAARLLLLVFVFGLAVGLPQLPAQPGKVKSPESKHAMDLAARKATQKLFSEATKYGVEVYLDPNVDQFVCLTDKGIVALQPKTGWTEAKGKSPEWKHAMNLRVRKAGEGDFSDKTQKIGVEVYLDPNTGNLVYITDTGHLASIPATSWTDAKDKPPEWKLAMELPARKASEKEVTKETKRYGVEVFLDPFTNHLIFISETGSLAVVPGTATIQGKVKDPVLKTAMNLAVRKAGEADFNEKTQKYGLEVFQDPNTSKIVFITETGQIAVPQAATFADTAKDKPAAWQHGLDLQARKAGENAFGPMTAKYGLEIFKEEGTGSLIYITEKGSIAVPVK
jgi:hypothetical protein